MVRVGRAEAMHPHAREVSSQQLAQRDAARTQQEPANPALDEEVIIRFPNIYFPEKIFLHSCLYRSLTIRQKIY
jgi:hypothetical protein